MATVSHANVIGPSQQEINQSAFSNFNNAMAGIRDANRLEEAKKQAAIQNASNQMQEYVKKQANGDYKYAAETNPELMKNWLKILLPNMDPEEAWKSIKNGPQTYAQAVDAMASEILNKRVNPNFFSMDKSLDDVIKKLGTLSAPEENAPKKEEGKAENTPAPGNSFTISTDNLPTKANVDMENLRRVLKAESSTTPITEPGSSGTISGVLSLQGKESGLPEKVVNEIRNSAPYKRAKELIASGQSPDQAVASLVGGSIIPPQEGVKLASQTTSQNPATPSKGTESVFKAGIDKATPEEKQLAQGLGQTAIGILQANPGKPVSEAVDEALAKIGINSDALIRQGMLGGKVDQNLINRANEVAKPKGIQGAEGLTNLRLSVIQNVTDATQGKGGDLGNVREGVEWTSTGVKGSPEAAKALEDLSTQTGAKVTSVLKTKTFSQLTDRERTELVRDVTNADRGAIREFQVARRQDDSLDRQMVSARYSLMANSLRELGLDMPENHPAMRVISNRPQLIDEYYKTALADAARAGILTREQAQQKWEIERKKVDVELMKLAMERDKTLNTAYEATGRLLNDSVENWMKNSKNVNRESTNPFADAYKYDRQTKVYFDRLMDIEEAVTGKKRNPQDAVYDVKNSSWWTIFPFTPKYSSESTSFGGGSSQGAAPKPLSKEAQAIIQEFSKR